MLWHSSCGNAVTVVTLLGPSLQTIKLIELLIDDVEKRTQHFTFEWCPPGMPIKGGGCDLAPPHASVRLDDDTDPVEHAPLQGREEVGLELVDVTHGHRRGGRVPGPGEVEREDAL